MHITEKFYFENKPKSSNQISYSIGFRKGKEKTIKSACDAFAEMLIEVCPELLGYGHAAKIWEDEFKSKLLEKL
jgi:hypothetical protein